MNKQELIDRIFYIDYREGWVMEEKLILLTNDEKAVAENMLIEMTNDHKLYWLAWDALSILKSTKALPILYQNMDDDTMSDCARLHLAQVIYKINGDSAMSEKAIGLFRLLTNEYDIIYGLGKLYRLNRPESKNIIAEFINHPKYLIAYNAKRYLALMGDSK